MQKYDLSRRPFHIYKYVGPRTWLLGLFDRLNPILVRVFHRLFVQSPALDADWRTQPGRLLFDQKDRLLQVLSEDSKATASFLVAILAWTSQKRPRFRGVLNGFFIPCKSLPSLPLLPDCTWFKLQAETKEPRFYWEAIAKHPRLHTGETASKITTKVCLASVAGADDYLRGKVVIDGGAWIGDTALLLQDSPAEKVYAFEPIPGIFEALVEVCAPFRKIQPVQLGLGKVDQEATFVVNDSGSRLAESGTCKIPVTTIDRFMAGRGETCGLIKLDVEGMESDVIEGAIETIKRDKPILVISIYHNPRDFFMIAQRIHALGLGYKLDIVPGHYKLLTEEIMLVGQIAAPEDAMNPISPCCHP